MNAILSWLNDFLYIYILVALLTAAGIYFTIVTKGVQFRLLKEGLRTLTEKKASASGISSFQALMISTASRVGTGNIIGVATAIAVGGPGAVFWMWLMALLGAASAFCESTLAQIYKVKSGDEFLGGPAYYIQQGLGKKWLGVLYAVLLIGCTAFGWNTTTAYNMSAALEYYVENYRSTIGPAVLGIILVILVGLVIFGGVSRIGGLSSVLVLVMAAAYIVFGLVCMVMNIGQIGSVVAAIFKDAFNFSAMTGGFAGSCIVQGVKRGLFSNEAGMGTGPNAAAAASCEHPVVQGMAQMISVFLDTLVICSATAMILLVSGVEGNAANAGSPYMQQAVFSIFGEWGIHMVTVALMLFAFTTLLGNYFYAEQNLKFITENRIVLILFRIAALVIIFIGTHVGFEMAWNITDILMALVAIVNILAVFALHRPIIAALQNYDEARKTTDEPIFRAKDIGLTNTDCWK